MTFPKSWLLRAQGRLSTPAAGPRWGGERGALPEHNPAPIPSPALVCTALFPPSRLALKGFVSSPRSIFRAGNESCVSAFFAERQEPTTRRAFSLNAPRVRGRACRTEFAGTRARVSSAGAAFSSSSAEGFRVCSSATQS